MRVTSAIFGITLGLGCQIAAAATITQYDRDAFQAALASSMLSGQDFDGLPVGPITTVDGVTFAASLGTALVTDSYLTTTNPNGLGSTSAGFFQNDETLTITFSSPISAFALDINTFASNNGDYQAVLNDGSSSVVLSLLDVFPNQETGQFFGFTDSSSFTSVVISPVSDPGTGNGSCGDFSTCSYTADTLVYGDASALTTPEPSTWAMMVLGFAGLGLAGWRGSRKAATRTA